MKFDRSESGGVQTLLGFFLFFMHVMNELSLSETKKKLYGKLIGNTTDLNNPETYALEKQNLPISTLRYRVGRTYPIGNPGFPNYKFFQPSIPTRRLYIPLYFWFNRDYGNALPLVSLQYSDVELTIVTRPITELYQLYYSKNGTQDYWAPDPTNSQHNLFNFVRNDRVTYMSTHTVLDTKAHLEINYVYLDNLERSYFAYKPVEYLITQTTQINLSDMQNTNIYNLTLQNPVTEFIWFIQRSDVALRNDWFNYTDPNYVSIMKQAKIMFNGIDRWENFHNVIAKGRKACETAGSNIDDHFRDITKMIIAAKGAQREVEDIALTRYACYLIAQNGDPANPAVAFASCNIVC